MIAKVRFAEEAASEFRRSVEWYDSKSNGLGFVFTNEIDSALERIKLNPSSYREIVNGIRRIQVNKFPFSIYYRLEGETLVVLRVFHNKRKPIQW
jgi:toxin ParE1/3/4